MFPHLLIMPYSEVNLNEVELLLVMAAASVPGWYVDIHVPPSQKGTRRSLKRFTMNRYSSKFARVPYQSINHLKKSLFCLPHGLQSLYCNRDEIRNLLILYIANAIAWVSIYSSYLPTPVKVAWVILSSYYRRSFENASRKNQAASL